MICNERNYIGIEISSGSRPFIYAALDQDLKVTLLERFSVSNVMAHLQQHDHVMLAVNVSFRKSSASNGHNVFNTLEKVISQAGFKPYLSKHTCRQWVETYPSECCSALAGHVPFSRRTTKGCLQRAAILYNHGLQIQNPRKFFEAEFDGAAGVKNGLLYTPSELDALVAAGIAWMLINKPVNIDLTREPERQMISIPREDKDWWRRKPVIVSSDQ